MSAEGRSKHERTVEAVEASVRQVGRDVLQGPALEGCVALWRDFADRTDLSRTRKPETWAAALAYAYERMRFGWASQADVAAAFGVSEISVSKKYRQIAEALDLVVLDARYLPEAMRAQVQREAGPIPEDLPLLEAPSGGWGWRPPTESFEALEAWLTERERGPLQRAQDRVYDGWEAFPHVEKAERCFRDALALDPTLADAHNGLGEVAETRDDLDTAEDHYDRAYALAREALGTESPDAFVWWLDLDTRPYMRAREGRAWVYEQTGRFREAIAELEALLELNPNDNQGVRYVIGPLYQLAGDLDGALDAYEAYETTYPDDMGDPHHTFCWGLALFEGGFRQNAVATWREAIFQNIYIVPLLLGEDFPDTDIWLSTNLAWPEHAEAYLRHYRRLWERSAGALAALRRLWRDPELRGDVDRWIEIGRRMAELRSDPAHNGGSSTEAEWLALVETQKEIEARPPSEGLVVRVLEQD
ncbi:MAG: tetratricopeptide repeat protein [Salinibacter sp.]